MNLIVVLVLYTVHVQFVHLLVHVKNTLKKGSCRMLVSALLEVYWMRKIPVKSELSNISKYLQCFQELCVFDKEVLQERG